MPAALLALVGALVYGAADFLGGLATKRLTALRAVAVAAVTGLVLLAVVAPIVGFAWVPADILWGAVSGVFGVMALVLLYACLAVGPMSILSPLTAVVSAIAPMLWGLVVGGEVLGVLGYGGLLVAVIAVVLVGFVPERDAVRPTRLGLAMAVGSGLAIGGLLICLDQTSSAGGLLPLVANRVVTTLATGAAVLTLLLAGRRTAGRPRLSRRGVLLGIGCGVLDAGANVLLLIALRVGDLSVVSALTALYPAGTIALAAVVLRERIAPVQWVGLALALTAGVMLGAA
ncbi:MAG: EamA family transporter [Microbacterium sp.]|uniref:EamA family transporter n=1 Tax=Microbacterium sp. TaxID=51671 RepID=UPI0039E6056C